MFSVIRTISHSTFINGPRLCVSYSSGSKIRKPIQRFRVREVPKDIWAEENDPRFTGTEVVEGKWQFVERLFPELRIPTPVNKPSSTEWRPLREDTPEGPYHVLRTRNHMLPVYEQHEKKGITKEEVFVTRVKKIQGDIYVFEAEAKAYLESIGNEKIESHVSEITCWVDFKGHHMEKLKEWLYDKGF